jgi:membrane protein DedA with SNARE-associated domain
MLAFPGDTLNSLDGCGVAKPVWSGHSADEQSSYSKRPAIHTTYPILFVAVRARQLCLPVPALLFLLSAGALAGSGKLSFPGILLAAVLGCVLADLVWFEAGRLRGKRVLRLLCEFTSDPSYCIRRGRELLAKKGLRLLLIAKFVPGLDGICPPLAGMLGASRGAFLLHDAGGATFWAGAYISCGFTFAKQLDQVEQHISSVATLVVLVFGIPLVHRTRRPRRRRSLPLPYHGESFFMANT